MRLGRFALLLLILGVVTAFFLLDLARFLDLAILKTERDALLATIDARPVRAAFLFLLVYVAVTALSLPGAAILTLAAGALFGLALGTLLASLASTAGAALAFLSARYIFRDAVSRRFGQRLRAIDEGMEKDGAFYLFALRLVPVFPFFLINLAMGLTAMRVWTFAWASQLGMLAGTLVYVNAGTQLAAIESPGDILSPGLIGAFLLLALFPFLARFALNLWKRRRLYRGFTRPRRFDRNLIVIGAGAAGLVTALIAATVRARVTLIEKGAMGGDCLNTGCVPSKALIRAARLAHDIRHAGRFGIAAAPHEIDFPALMARIDDAIATIAPADSVERYTGLGVDVRKGKARILNPWTVEIEGGERLTARAIVLAGGAAPALPDIPGLADCAYLTSETLWDALRTRQSLPERLVILGGGPIGCELAQAFARLGSLVTVIDRNPRILNREEEEAATLVADILREEGVTLLTGHQVLRCTQNRLIASAGESEIDIPFDDLIVATGRKPRLSGYGLEALGIDPQAPLPVNAWLQTPFPNIYAAGDIAGPHRFTHAAAHQAWHAAVNALFGGVKKFKVDYTYLPRVTFTDPEVAHIGLDPATAQARGIAHQIARYDLGHLDRAVAEGANQGFVKLVVGSGGRILGATIVAAQAGEMLAEIALAMKHGIGLDKLLATIHAYPTFAEANKFAAGEWKKANKPERLLALAEKYHAWRRR